MAKITAEVKAASSNSEAWIKQMTETHKKLRALWKEQPALTKQDLDYYKGMISDLKSNQSKLLSDIAHMASFAKSNLKQKANQDQTRERHDAIDAIQDLLGSSKDSWEIVYRKAHGWGFQSDDVRRVQSE